MGTLVSVMASMSSCPGVKRPVLPVGEERYQTVQGVQSGAPAQHLSSINNWFRLARCASGRQNMQLRYIAHEICAHRSVELRQLHTHVGQPASSLCCDGRCCGCHASSHHSCPEWQGTASRQRQRHIANFRFSAASFASQSAASSSAHLRQWVGARWRCHTRDRPPDAPAFSSQCAFAMSLAWATISSPREALSRHMKRGLGLSLQSGPSQLAFAHDLYSTALMCDIFGCLCIHGGRLFGPHDDISEAQLAA